MIRIYHDAWSPKCQIYLTVTTVLLLIRKFYNIISGPNIHKFLYSVELSSTQVSSEKEGYVLKVWAG